MVVKSVIRYKLIDQEAVALGAVADERNEVAVVDTANDLHLCPELPLPLSAPGFELLHRHLSAVRQHALVHGSESAFADDVVG